MSNDTKATPLHFASEFLLALESDDYPKTDYSQIQLRGKLDTNAFVEAFNEAIPEIDVAHSHIEDRREKMGHRLYWVRNGDINNLIVEDCRHMMQDYTDPVDFIQAYHHKQTLRRINLYEELPIRFHLLRVADDVHLFSMLFHHISMDAAVGYIFIRKILAIYHEKVTGEAPSWAETRSIGSTLHQVNQVKPQPIVPFIREQVYDLFLSPRSSISKIATSGEHATKGRRMERVMIEDPKCLQGMRALTKMNEATLGDVLNATITQAIASWDKDKGQIAEKIRALTIVNIRGRLPETKDESIALSGLNITVPRADQMDLGQLVRYFRDQRKLQLKKGVDIALCRMLETTAKASRFLPMHIRGTIARHLISSPVTFLLSNIGIMWPEVKDGRLTGRSAFTHAGGLELDDIHSCPSMSPDVGMGCVARTMGGRFFLNYSCDNWHFTTQEAKDVTAHISGKLESLAEYAPKIAKAS